jgi:hypothetical protein
MALADKLKNMDKSKLAKNLLAQKEANFSLSRSMKKSWKRISLRVVMLIFAIYLYLNVVQNEAFILVIGIIIGGTLQDIGWILRIAKVWGFSEEVIDWGKVEQLATNNSLQRTRR